ncbi:MAG TPA: glycoside hydrolase family 13 protein [Anaerolineae bacterium]|nr:glycoside hydrolase family 13 protein [Anaerolineae bacterium]
MPIKTPDWVKDAVFYQIFPDRFAKSDTLKKPTHLQPWGAPPTYHAFQGGDLIGVIEKLDYLADLGINAIYFNPIFMSASNHRYHTFDYYQVDPLLGGNDAFKKLLKAAHKKNIRVILDGVFNHASRGFFQFNHLMECGQESPYRDWFHVHGWPINAFNETQPANYSAWWGLHALPKFNTNTEAVREYLLNVGTYWLEMGADGWRLDVPNEIDDDEFWREFRRRCRAVNPEAYIVGELWTEAHRWLQGDQFDAQMNYLFTRAAFGFFCGERLNHEDIGRTGYQHIPVLDALSFGARLNEVNNKLYDYEIVLAQMNMLGSHDTPRMLTVANGDKTAVRLLFLCQMTQPGAPNIYYGDEIGLPGRHDPDCRRAFPWHDLDSWDNDLLTDIKSYIALRHELPALRRGDFEVIHAQKGVAIYRRQYEGRTAVIAFNASHSAQQATFAWTTAEDASPLPQKLVDKGKPLPVKATIKFPPRTARVWAD